MSDETRRFLEDALYDLAVAPVRRESEGVVRNWASLLAAAIDVHIRSLITPEPAGVTHSQWPSPDSAPSVWLYVYRGETRASYSAIEEGYHYVPVGRLEEANARAQAAEARLAEGISECSGCAHPAHTARCGWSSAGEGSGCPCETRDPPALALSRRLHQLADALWEFRKSVQRGHAIHSELGSTVDGLHTLANELGLLPQVST